MPTVEDLLSTALYTIEPWASVRRAGAVMEYHGIGSLAVIDEEGKLVGIITSRDIKGSHPNRLVADAMSRQVITINPSASLWEAHHLMVTHNLERLVVMEGQQVIGIITGTKVMAELGKYVDSLTNLHKAEILYERAVQLLTKGCEISVIFLDLDDFGRLNKQYGHVHGDHILVRTAQILKGLTVEGRDTLCRYGGDEFAVLTPQSLAAAEGLAREMVKAVQGEKWSLPIHITLSAGIAGGRRVDGMDTVRDLKELAEKLVNQASLASTTAKRLKVPVMVANTDRLPERRPPTGVEG
ncbi:GGDEF domain-containing protein [Thermanaeromonas sp. C210]|uniref:GGDEF domain-containing protein n=1 Tax=Thermanaeromonas sp. C210 TaxID=2731925 RepID=UPI00155B5BB6|nr:GGDEF domain-containing protein [Thermanaeromonas sp. C210]GFN21879.1 diguanylate cyclase [Thermanaeromonas sp. C210]